MFKVLEKSNLPSDLYTLSKNLDLKRLKALVRENEKSIPDAQELMDELNDQDQASKSIESLIAEIRKVSQTVEGVIETEKCFIRKAGMKYHVDLHAVVDADISVKQGHEISHVLKDTLRHEIPQLGHVLIHIEPNDY